MPGLGLFTGPDKLKTRRDSRADVPGHACLVAIMAMDHGIHRVSQQRLHGRTAGNGGAAPVITSGGALLFGAY